MMKSELGLSPQTLGGECGFKRILGCRANRTWWLTGYGGERGGEKEKQNRMCGVVSGSLSLPSSSSSSSSSFHRATCGRASTYRLISSFSFFHCIRIPSFWRDKRHPRIKTTFPSILCSQIWSYDWVLANEISGSAMWLLWGASLKGSWHVSFDTLFVSLLHPAAWTVGMMDGALATVIDQGTRNSLGPWGLDGADLAPALHCLHQTWRWKRNKHPLVKPLLFWVCHNQT